MAVQLEKLARHYKEKGNMPRANLYAALAAEERAIGGPETVVPEPQAAVAPESPALPPPTPNFYIKRPVEGLVLPSADQLVISARAELKNSFGRDFEVPVPPAELFETLEGFAERGITRFDETYYFPRMRLQKGNKFWEGRDKVQPEDFFWDQIKNSSYPPEVAELEEGWYIGDRRSKPMYANGQQKYGEDDYMEPLMAYLRGSNPPRIQRHSRVPDAYRAGASPEEIEGVILPAFAEMSGVKGVVRNRRYIEFNVRGNMAHPEWGQTNTWEWFGDPVFQGASRLIGGRSDDGGLAYVYSSPVDARYDYAGFSPVVAFPSKAR